MMVVLLTVVFLVTARRAAVCVERGGGEARSRRSAVSGELVCGLRSAGEIRAAGAVKKWAG